MTDLTFITNEEGQTLKDRFRVLIKDTRLLDCLVGFFYTSGFYEIYEPLEKTEKIRILIGIGTNQETLNRIQQAEGKIEGIKIVSHYQAKKIFSEEISDEMENSENDKKVAEGIAKFIQWINKKKIEIKVHPSRNIHSKLYILTFQEGDRDVGRVITGSSNFTSRGLVDNLEFNVELKNRSDYEFAKSKFEKLWKEAVDVSEEYIKTINERTWLNQTITPYELYLKLLYEYFKDELARTDELVEKFLPENFLKLEYQEQAILNAKKILEEYGGVFISDVVGLGKTYIAAMLIQQIGGRTMVIAPPALLKKESPGSWPNVFADFNLPAKYISTGKLEEAVEETEQRKYHNIIIDESHRFRNESTISYESIAEVCRGKRIILVSATPYNNSPSDVLNQIKLFQSGKKSNIPGMPNLEGFFNSLKNKLDSINRHDNYPEYLLTVKKNAVEIRDKVLKYIMVRRTRTEIEKYFKEDLEKNKVKFPEVEDPKPLLYQLSEEEDKIFMKTMHLITNEFKYARYMPLLYLNRAISAMERQRQINMGGFMKVLLVKRLESSFCAFKNSIDRFINSYEMFIECYNNGVVYFSPKHLNKIFEFVSQENDEAIQNLIEEGRAKEFAANEFSEQLIEDLKSDLKILKEIKSDWESIKRDPKLNTLIENLENDELLKTSKLIIFTESKETAEYLGENITKKFGNIALVFHSEVPNSVRSVVIDNFDARVRNPKSDYRILISTEVLAEGVNLHQANIVMNYDIPWNPTRMMQRVGRINRVDTKFDKIYTYNFFPTVQAESEIELTKIARSKIEAFLNLLGGDAAILTEGEPVASHELFDKLISKESLIEDESEETELKYLKIIETVRDTNPELFEKIKRVPKKASSCKETSEYFSQKDSLITFFRKGKLMKFFLTEEEKNSSTELDFLTSAKMFECDENTKRESIPTDNYYKFLEINKDAFLESTEEESADIRYRGGPDSPSKLLSILRAVKKDTKQLTEEQEEYLENLISIIEKGSLPKSTAKRTLNVINTIEEEKPSPLKIMNVVQNVIPRAFLKEHYSDSVKLPESKREVILSLYLKKKTELDK